MSAPAKACVMIGLGYIGLPTAVVLAKHGVKVHGVDINEQAVKNIKAGRCTIVEPGLPEMLEQMVGEGKLTAGTSVVKGDVFIIAVPTPFEGGYKPDLSYVEKATHSIAPLLEKGNLVVVESTVPVGATEQVSRWLAAARPDLTFSHRNGGGAPVEGDVLVAHCPERILPGNMLKELVENDRVIGGVCPASGEAGRAFYKTFVKGECLVTDARTAELAKLTENAFRDVNIAFANELSTICEELDIDVWRLIELANHHPRVNILQPGPGVGGHCIAVDPWFIVSAFGEKARLIREARWINSGRPRHVVRDVLTKLKQTDAKSVACFGLSYKPNIDDLRESPAVEVVEHLASELHFHHAGVDLMAVEPHVDTLPRELQGKPVRLVSVEEALKADLLVMLVDHAQFRAMPANKVAGKAVVDTRGVWRNKVP